MGKSKDGVFYVTDMVRMRGSSLDVQNTIKNTATRDGYPCKIVLEQDPGQAGKAEAEYLIRMLQGFNVKAVPVKKDKITRAGPFSAQCEAGNVKLLRGQWNEALLSELELFPLAGRHDDIVDSLTASANYLMTPGLNYEGLTVL
jgi:predicted phage terminase large subunit-like protein